MRLRVEQRLISLLTAVALLFGMAIPAFAAENGATETATVLFGDSFNADVTGEVPPGWYVMQKDGIIAVAETPTAVDKSVQYHARPGSGGDMFMQTDLSMSEKQMVADFKVRFESLDVGQLRLQLRDSTNKDFLPLSFSKGQIVLFDGTTIGKYSIGKFYRVTVAMDFDAETLNVWVNGKRKTYNVSFRGRLTNIAMMRMHFTQITSECDLYFDDIYLYTGNKPMDAAALTDEESAENNVDTEAIVSEKMKDAIALYENRGNALVKGEKTKIDENPSVTPFTENGVTYVPLRFLAECFGGAAVYQPEDDSVVVTYRKQTYTVSDKTTEIHGGRAAIKAEAAPRVIEGRYFVPIGAACRMFEKQLFFDECGLAVLSEEANFLSWDKDLDLINAIVKAFIYNEYEASELIAKLRENNPDKAHPRIMATQKTFSSVAARLENDPDSITKKLWNVLQTRADGYLTAPISTYQISDGVRLLEISRQVLVRVQDLAFVYNVTGDERYAQRAWMELYSAALFPDWNPTHFLDVGEMCAAFAIGYDWLYNYLSEYQREVLRTAIIEHGFMPLMDEIENKPMTRAFNWLNENYVNNWMFVCMGGEAIAALAIGDEPEAEELAGNVLSTSLTEIERALALFAPAGQWTEGITYWGLAMQYMQYYVNSLDTAMGTDFGRFDVPGIRKTLDYVMAMNGSVEAFNFSDAPKELPYSHWTFLPLSRRLNRPELARPLLEKLESGVVENPVEDLLYYDSEFFAGTKSADRDLDAYVPVIETTAMRSSWESDALYVGFHNGSNAEPHAHLDTGSFVLDADGERFFLDLGKDDYNLAGGTFNRYRYRAEGHNCLVINPDGGYDQPLDASAKVTRFETKPRGAFAVSDLTDAYRDDAESAVRGVMLTDNRSAVIVQDELSLKQPSEVYWFAHTYADIKIAEDGRSAILSQGGKRLYAKILSEDGAKFTMMEAKPLPDSPVIAGQAENNGVSKLTIHLTNYAGGTLSVGFAPLSPVENSHIFASATPISGWSIADGELKYASADGITIDGEPLEGFSPEQSLYTYTVPGDEDGVPVVYAEGASEITQAKSTSMGIAVVKAAAKNGEIPRTYYITFVKEPKIGVPKGLVKLSVASVEASQVPQPENGAENILDGDYQTRWAAEGASRIECDLGSVKTVDAVGVAFMRGDERTAWLQIELSEDGENYHTIFVGDSSGTTAEQEIYETGEMQARYIRLNCNGSSEGSWTSVTEVAVYSK